MGLPTSESVVFEDDYLSEFDRRFIRKFGLELSIPRDYIAIDKGICLYSDESRKFVGQVKAWFQFKGIMDSKSTSEKYDTAEHIIAKNIKASHIKFWGGFGEPVFLVVYSQKDNEFYYVDCESIQEFSEGKDEVNIKIYKTNILNDELFIKLRESRPSIRGDIATYRGRPISVNLDPLRSCIAPISQSDYLIVIRELLSQHSMLIKSQEELAGATILRGEILDPLECPIYFTVEFGYSESLCRENGEIESVSGNVVVYVIPDPDSFDIDTLETNECEKLVVFYNRDESDSLFGKINSVNGLACSNFGLTYNLLLAPVLYSEVKSKIKWRLANPLVKLS